MTAELPAFAVTAASASPPAAPVKLQKCVKNVGPSTTPANSDLIFAMLVSVSTVPFANVKVVLGPG